MSYLLKALQKAEQERKQGQEQTADVAVPSATATLPKWLMACLFVFLSVSTLKLLGFMENSPSTEIEQSDMQQVIVPADKNKTETLPATSIKLKDVKFKSIKPELLISEPLVPEPLELAQLSPLMLKKIPTLMLESHIYSSAAQYRSVVINGQSYSEGMLLNAHVLLSEITSGGIVIKVDDQDVALPKGISWVAAQ